MGAREPINRVAMITVHTSPTDQPGSGAAGGMNVYVNELARALGARGVTVDLFTRASSAGQPDAEPVADHVTVHRVADVDDPTHDPAALAAFADAVDKRATGAYDVVHTHYWLAGQVGLDLRRRWGTPLVHTPHTLARVKRRLLPSVVEHPRRIRGEVQVVNAADRLIASTEDEAHDLVGAYGVARARIAVVPPGVDPDVFRPGDAPPRSRYGAGPGDLLIAFAGRIQRLKGLHLLVRAIRRLRTGGLDVHLAVAGAPSGDEHLRDHLRDTPFVTRLGPLPRTQLADLFRAADVVAVPSYSESFGLVALEAQACGTPVVAADVGGLRVAVRDGFSGLLVDRQSPTAYALTLRSLLTDPERRTTMARAAIEHAAGFTWAATAAATLDEYKAAGSSGRGPMVEDRRGA